MKVILIEDVDKLGKLGDVLEVKKGYARNFLFPRNLAVEAGDKSLKVLEERKKRRGQQLAKEKRDADELAEKIGNISFTIPMAAGEDDKLFGSVTTEDVASALLSEGIKIDKKKIHIAEPIKKLGVYQVEIKLHTEIFVTARIWVVKK